MIDVHSHILPGVDDGPKSLEESLEMIRMAYENGIRCIIATPHLNHPLGFASEGNIEAVYKNIRTLATQSYKELGLVLGAELYISENYIDLMETKPFPFTLGSTNYVLIEFQRGITSDEILNVIHEFSIRNYRPILAHIEMYPELVGKIEVVRELRNTGAYIQITSSSLLGKQGASVSSFLRKLVRCGLVDFVATDAHGSTKRRPHLKEAYHVVSKLTNERDAQRIFVNNPKALITGKYIAQPTYAIKTGYSKIVKLNLVAASVAVFLILSSILVSLWNRGDAQSDQVRIANDSVIDEIITEFALDQSAEVESTTATSSEILISTEDTNKVSETKNEKVTEEIVPTKSEIEKRYVDALTRLKEDYVEQLDAIVANIKITRSNIKDDTQRKALLDAYVDEIIAMESRSDNTVYDLLYVMQNELESYGYDVSLVKEMREGYLQIKEDKENAYLAELGY